MSIINNSFGLSFAANRGKKLSTLLDLYCDSPKPDASLLIYWPYFCYIKLILSVYIKPVNCERQCVWRAALKIYIFMFALLTVLVGLSACEVSGDGSGGNRVVVTPAIKPSTVTVQVGDIVELQLPTIPIDGYQWVVDEINTAVLVQDGDAIYTPDDTPDSAGGIVSISFKAVGAGSTLVSLSYVSEPTDQTPSFTTNTFTMTADVVD